MNRSCFLLLIFLLPLSLFAREGVDRVRGLQVHDQLSIRIKGVPESDRMRVNGVYQVSKEGKVFVPLLKEGVQVQGLSLAQAADRIEKAYRDGGIYTKPKISVTSKDDGGCILIAPPGIRVGGHVQKPGRIRFQKGMTLDQVLDAAGGATRTGSTKRVELYRQGKRVVYDLRKPEDQKVKVERDDAIHVPAKNYPGR